MNQPTKILDASGRQIGRVVGLRGDCGEDRKGWRQIVAVIVTTTDKNLTVVSGGRAVERQTVNRGDGGSIPPTGLKLKSNFVHLTFVCVFRRKH